MSSDYALDALTGTFGDFELPVDAADFTTTLVGLDPALSLLAGLFKTAINSELGTVWTKVTDVLPESHPFHGTDPVEDTLELEPSPEVMQQVKVAFPLLCVYRTGDATYEQVTFEDDRLVQDWGIDYILGPMSIGDLRRFAQVAIAVVKVIGGVIRKRGHEDYDSGALQFFPSTGGFSSVQLMGYTGPGQAEFAGDEKRTPYYAVSLKLRTAERSNDTSTSFDDFDAVDFTTELEGESDDKVVTILSQTDDSEHPA